jgi:hypothetical protein
MPIAAAFDSDSQRSDKHLHAQRQWGGIKLAIGGLP